MMMTHVHLTYFKESGKYYSEGEVDLRGHLAFHEAISGIRVLLMNGKWPGLSDGPHSFYTVARVYGEFGPLSFLIPLEPHPTVSDI